MTVQIIPPAWLSAVEYRHASLSDLPALEWDGEYIHFRNLYSEVYAAVQIGKALMMVAELDSSILLGQLFIQLLSTRTELADGLRRAYIYGFRVKPGYRNYGVGAGLLLAAEAELLRRDFRLITLNVAQDNPAGRRFYERYGYRVVAVEPGRWSYRDHEGQLREVHEPAWRMEKRFNGVV